MRRQITVYVLMFLLSMILTKLWWPIDDTQCNSEAFLASKNQKFQVQATKVVVQPWRGEHHVYGIFMVPDEYKKTPFFVLTVKGAESKCSKPFGYNQNYDDIFAEPNTHLIRMYFKTRVALRLILQGLYSQLNNPQNWTLTYPQAK
ncbi:MULTISPECIES: hypothetical protein [unclassified Anabaena]|uniref:hypothetical protein n=1 Tax=unclassified Anabaena TaxID=2619674 RepID=UPI0008300FE5|nr:MULTISPECIES: hypothetical protein [unclassified Anabaena]